MTTWDTTVDFVIAGSGGGGMVAALAAADAGAEALVLEKQALVGGSTCMSGGIVWIPNNPLMQAEGVPDSYEDAMAHFETVVGDVGPCSSFERRHAFLTAGPEMTTFLQRLGVRLVTCPGYSDYYSNLKGGHDVGRGIEPVPWDGRALGPWLPKLQPGLAQSLGLAVMTNEARSLSNYNRSVRSFAISARVALRTVGGQGPAAGAAHERRVAHRSAARRRRRPRDPGVDRGPARRPDRGGRPRRGGAHGARRRTGVGPGPAGGADLGRRLRPQPRDAPAVRRRPAQRGQVVDVQPRRHRRGDRHRDAARRPDRADGRGLVAAVAEAPAASASRRSTRPASGRAPSTSTPPGGGS